MIDLINLKQFATENILSSFDLVKDGTVILQVGINADKKV